MEIPSLDTGEVQRGPSGLSDLHRRTVDLDLADADRAVARHESK
jgi:hypothetical protein